MSIGRWAFTQHVAPAFRGAELSSLDWKNESVGRSPPPTLCPNLDPIKVGLRQ